MQQFFLLVENGQVLSSECKTVDQWPWSWYRALNYVRHVQGIYERAHMNKGKRKVEEVLPPKTKWFDYKFLDEWWEDMKDSK